MPTDNYHSLTLRYSMAITIAMVTLLSATIFSLRGQSQHFIEPKSIFRANGDLVVVPVSVSDRKGHTVLGLRADDFTVLDDHTRQDIVSFSRWEVPSSIGVIFDVSGSMRGTEDIAVTATRALIDEMTFDDEGFLVTFADIPRVEVGMTRELERIPDHLSFLPRQGATALFDAIGMGFELLKGAHTPRRALAVVTDGGDNRSRLSFHELLSRALEADVQVYAIEIRRNGWDADAQRGRAHLDRLAAETGGRSIVIYDTSQLKEKMSLVGELIRNQYLIGYKPPGGAQIGKWRQIRVRMQSPRNGSLRINAKGGYYAPQN